MAIKKFITGNFYDEKVLFPAVTKVRKAGYKLYDVYTPFPIHGLDKVMGQKTLTCTLPVLFMVSPEPLPQLVLSPGRLRLTGS